MKKTDAEIYEQRAQDWSAKALRIAKSGKREGGYSQSECERFADDNFALARYARRLAAAAAQPSTLNPQPPQ